MTLQTKGTPEQKEVFPKRLYLSHFARAWNKDHNDPNFVERQLEEMQKFDSAEQDSVSLPVPSPTHTTTPAPSAPSKPSMPSMPSAPAKNPRPKHSSPPRPGPSSQLHTTHRPAAHPSIPIEPTRSHDRTGAARPDRDNSGGARKADVPMRHHSPPRFTDMDKDENAYEPSSSPPPPTHCRQPKPE